MPNKQEEMITRYLEDAISAERSIASQFESLADDGDDDDVKALLAAGARLAQKHGDELSGWFVEGHENSPVKALAANAIAGLPRVAEAGHIQEERTVQSLMAAYSMEMSACGVYRALAAITAGVRDGRIVQMAETFETENRSLAERLFHLIPTRSIIVYNMLTLTEVDPAVETKYREASWTG